MHTDLHIYIYVYVTARRRHRVLSVFYAPLAMRLMHLLKHSLTCSLKTLAQSPIACSIYAGMYMHVTVYAHTCVYKRKYIYQYCSIQKSVQTCVHTLSLSHTHTYTHSLTDIRGERICWWGTRMGVRKQHAWQHRGRSKCMGWS